MPRENGGLNEKAESLQMTIDAIKKNSEYLTSQDIITTYMAEIAGSLAVIADALAGTDMRRTYTDNYGKRAQWLINSDGYYPYCSACMAEPENGEMTDYCPSCGARMKKRTDD